MIGITTASSDYELLDSGDGQKLERYGNFVLARPDPQALWKPVLSKSEWAKADAVFVRKGKSGEWLHRFEENGRPIPKGDLGKKKKTLPSAWEINFGDLRFEIRPTSFKHTGLFPEHRSNWEWMAQKIDVKRKTQDVRSEPIKVLNLFGYTGGASLACAKAGAEVCHVDGSKTAIAWARKNQELSGLAEKPIRWILDDAVLFLKREVKRGNKYEAIIMDPPAFGHGAKGEVWKIEENFAELMDLCFQVLSDTPLFFLINGYASGYSPIAYQNNLLPLTEKFNGNIEIGELAIEESKTGRLLPCGIFARWATAESSK